MEARVVLLSESDFANALIITRLDHVKIALEYGCVPLDSMFLTGWDEGFKADVY
jgi:hypothetical protein